MKRFQACKVEHPKRPAAPCDPPVRRRPHAASTSSRAGRDEKSPPLHRRRRSCPSHPYGDDACERYRAIAQAGAPFWILEIDPAHASAPGVIARHRLSCGTRPERCVARPWLPAGDDHDPSLAVGAAARSGRQIRRLPRQVDRLNLETSCLAVPKCWTVPTSWSRTCRAKAPDDTFVSRSVGRFGHGSGPSGRKCCPAPGVAKHGCERASRNRAWRKQQRKFVAIHGHTADQPGDVG